MNSSSVYRVNSPAVVGEVIDGEAIIIHLESGTYYSARDTAVRAWELIAQGANIGQIVDRLTQEYDINPLDVSFSLTNFINQLMAHQLIVEVAGATGANLEASAPTMKQSYNEPRLEVFRDMQNLLMLDPIHQVQPDVGWPAPLDGNSP